MPFKLWKEFKFHEKKKYALMKFLISKLLDFSKVSKELEKLKEANKLPLEKVLQFTSNVNSTC